MVRKLRGNVCATNLSTEEVLLIQFKYNMLMLSINSQPALPTDMYGDVINKKAIQSAIECLSYL